MTNNSQPLSTSALLENKKTNPSQFIQRLLVPVLPVAPSVPCEDVYRIFANDISIQSIAVVDGETPVGLVNRFALVDRFSRRFFREIYERKPIAMVMEKNFLSVESTVHLDDLSSIIADEEEKYLYEGFIITEDGKYRGIGTGHRLIKEVTEQKQAQLYHIAHHDTLTGLPNRLLFYDRLSQAMAQSARNAKSLAVLFIDLDHFKQVNDSLGHPMGDLLLRETAERIRLCLREGDTVARQGGDEFTVILNGLAQSSDASMVGRKILEYLSSPIEIGGNTIHITCSIGASLFPEDGDTIENLIKNADAAVYHAKRIRNTFSYFSQTLPSLNHP